jgi:hypothetical protein
MGHAAYFGGAGMFDVYVVECDSLMVGRPKGILDARAAERIVEFIELKEFDSENGFNRFCDLTALEGIQLSFSEILYLAIRRSSFNPDYAPVKSAFLAIHPFAFAIARMYEQMLCSPRIEVRVFGELKLAAEWLGVSPDKLML